MSKIVYKRMDNYDSEKAGLNPVFIVTRYRTVRTDAGRINQEKIVTKEEFENMIPLRDRRYLYEGYRLGEDLEVYYETEDHEFINLPMFLMKDPAGLLQKIEYVNLKYRDPDRGFDASIVSRPRTMTTLIHPTLNWDLNYNTSKISYFTRYEKQNINDPLTLDNLIEVVGRREPASQRLSDEDIITIIESHYNDKKDDLVVSKRVRENIILNRNKDTSDLLRKWLKKNNISYYNFLNRIHNDNTDDDTEITIDKNKIFNKLFIDELSVERVADLFDVSKFYITELLDVRQSDDLVKWCIENKISNILKVHETEWLKVHKKELFEMYIGMPERTEPKPAPALIEFKKKNEEVTPLLMKSGKEDIKEDILIESKPVIENKIETVVEQEIKTNNDMDIIIKIRGGKVIVEIENLNK